MSPLYDRRRLTADRRKVFSFLVVYRRFVMSLGGCLPQGDSQLFSRHVSTKETRSPSSMVSTRYHFSRAAV